MPIFAPEREAALFQARRIEAEEKGVPADLVEDILRRIMQDLQKPRSEWLYLC